MNKKKILKILETYKYLLEGIVSLFKVFIKLFICSCGISLLIIFYGTNGLLDLSTTNHEKFIINSHHIKNLVTNVFGLTIGISIILLLLVIFFKYLFKGNKNNND